jgi:hypothetical protein
MASALLIARATGAGRRGAKTCSTGSSPSTRGRAGQSTTSTASTRPPSLLRLARETARRRDFAVFADAGPDLIRPWRRPSTLILYTHTAFGAAHLDSVDAAGMNDANVIVRMPADPSVFPAGELAAEFMGARIPLADPVQMIWDLHDLGGGDRAEAAGSYGNGCWTGEPDSAGSRIRRR